MYYETKTDIRSATVNICFEYDIETHDELSFFKGNESIFNSFDSVFRINLNGELPSYSVRRIASLSLSLCGGRLGRRVFDPVQRSENVAYVISIRTKRYQFSFYGLPYIATAGCRDVA